MKAVPEPEGNLERREVGVTLIPNPGPVLVLDSYCPMAWGHGNSTLPFLLQSLLVQVAQIQHATRASNSLSSNCQDTMELGGTGLLDPSSPYCVPLAIGSAFLISAAQRPFQCFLASAW